MVLELTPRRRHGAVINVGDVVLLPDACFTDRADYPCPFAGQRVTVTSSQWMQDEGCYLITVQLPAPVTCAYWGAIAAGAPSETCCLYSTDVTLVAPRGDPRGHHDLIQLLETKQP